MVKIAYVKWIDASGSNSVWEVQGIARLKPSTNESAGVLLLEDENRITIAQDVWDNSDGTKMARDVETIPRNYIVKMKTWGVK